MRFRLAFTVFASLIPASGWAQESGEFNVSSRSVAQGRSSTLGVDIPSHSLRTDSIPSDWDTEFASDSARTDFKRLRGFRAEKQSLLALLRPQGDLLRVKRERLQAEIDRRSPILREVTQILLNVGPRDDSVRVGFRPGAFDAAVGYETPGFIPVSVLRSVQSDLIGQDSTDQRQIAQIGAFEKTLQANIDHLEYDLRQAEAAIDAALAPEYKSQEFRVSVSAFFSALIAVMIISFFAIIFMKSGDDVGRLLLSDGGLQFVTIFVLIIAIILFGILNILEGRELAAILSGIAGYILGRGARIRPDGFSEHGIQPRLQSPEDRSGGAPAKVPVTSIFPLPGKGGTTSGEDTVVDRRPHVDEALPQSEPARE